MIIYGGLLYSISCSTCEAQHFSDGSLGEKSEDDLKVAPEKQMTKATLCSELSVLIFLQKTVWKKKKSQIVFSKVNTELFGPSVTRDLKTKEELLVTLPTFC